MRGCRHRRRFEDFAFAALLLAATGPAAAAELAPFEAVYDLALTGKSLDLVGGDGRIAVTLSRPACGRIDIDYRFVARFEREDATVVTDQRTTSAEDLSKQSFDFTTRTFVDGAPESVIRGTARSTAAGTRVEIEEPARQAFDLPLSVFPSAHAMDLIDRAEAGEHLVETRLYDGDNEAGKRLTTTAVIAKAEPGPPTAGKPDDRDGPAAAAQALAGLRRWRISESYYNSDSDADGLPLFQTSYTLYENGVSDALTFDTGDYAFAGSLSKLVVGKPPACGPRS